MKPLLIILLSLARSFAAEQADIGVVNVNPAGVAAEAAKANSGLS